MPHAIVIGGGDGAHDALVRDYFLHDAPTPAETRRRVTEAALATVPGCDHAAISLLDLRAVAGDADLVEDAAHDVAQRGVVLGGPPVGEVAR